MKIEGVVISCYAFDVHLTRICVASIRFWYPDIPIWLLKDRQYGDFDTSEIENGWKVGVYPGRQRNLGWGFGKLEVMTELPARRLFIIDSDIVFVGRVLDRLETLSEDFVVDAGDFDAAGVEEQFFDLAALRQLDPHFGFPGFGFNTGQVVVTTGCLSKDDLAGLVDWSSRTVTHADIFKKGEQGLLNYVALKERQLGKLTLRREPFMVWPGIDHLSAHIRLNNLTREAGYPELIHWAGLRWGKTLEEMPRPEILSHFEAMYYDRIPRGAWLRRWRRAQFRIERSCVAPLKDTIKKVFFKPALAPTRAAAGSALQPGGNS